MMSNNFGFCLSDPYWADFFFFGGGVFDPHCLCEKLTATNHRHSTFFGKQKKFIEACQQVSRSLLIYAQLIETVSKRPITSKSLVDFSNSNARTVDKENMAVQTMATQISTNSGTLIKL